MRRKMTRVTACFAWLRMAIIKLGEVGIGLPNEYTVHKALFSKARCS